MKYKGITILDNSDPHNEELYTFANFDLAYALEVFRESRPDANGLVMVHVDGKWKLLGELKDIEVKV